MENENNLKSETLKSEIVHRYEEAIRRNSEHAVKRTLEGRLDEADDLWGNVERYQKEIDALEGKRVVAGKATLAKESD